MDKSILNRPSFIFFISGLFLIIALAPVWWFQYFPTVDGPAHLYNAKIIRELWWGDAALYSQAFKFNSELVPNWTGHFIAVLTGVLFPVWMTEKIIILLIILGLLTGIYRLSAAFGAQPSWHLLLLLPLIYTITLYLGFFNFMFSLVFMLYLLALLSEDVSHSKLYYVKILLLATLVYFSHVLAFGVALIFMGCFFIWKRFDVNNTPLFSRTNILKAICFLPGLVFAVIFFSSREVEGFRNKMERVPVNNLVQMALEGGPMVGLNGAEETPYTTIFMTGILILMVIIFVSRIRNKLIVQQADLLLVFAVIMFIAYFFVPDGMAAGGFISVRLLLITLIFILAWILTAKLPVWISVLAGVLGVITSFATLPYRLNATSQLSSDAQNIVELKTLMKPGSYVLPFNYAENWLHLNLPGYLGATGDFVLLENYEADFNEFPLQWQDGFAPGDLFGDFKKTRITDQPIEKYEAASNVTIDYVVRWLYDPQTTDSTTIAFDKYLRSHFSSSKRVGHGEVLN